MKEEVEYSKILKNPIVRFFDLLFHINFQKIGVKIFRELLILRPHIGTTGVM